MLKYSNPLPKYCQVREYIKRLIEEGHIIPGEQLPSENSLVKELKVSRHTIRQAFSDLENEGWIRREQGRGTFCNFRQKSSALTVAVLTTYLSNYIFPTIIRGIEEVLSTAGYMLILSSTDNDKRKESSCMEKLIQENIAGFIIEPTQSAIQDNNLSFFIELEKKKIPYVMLHAVYPGIEPAYVMMDDEKGGYLATKYILQLGHKKIAGIFKADDLQGVKRQAGFSAALSDYRVPLGKGFLGNYNTDQLSYYPYQFTRSLLQREDRPTAIVCYNDQIALHALEAIRDLGLKVPEDISLVGYDDSNLALASEVKLTTIRHPKEDMGREAARMLIYMLRERMSKPSLIYEPELIVRSSCRGLST